MKQPFFLPCLILTHTISFGRQVFKCYLVDNIRSASVTSHYFINTRWTTPPSHYSSVQLSVRSLPLLLSHCLKRSHDCKMKIDHEGIQRTNFLLGVLLSKRAFARMIPNLQPPKGYNPIKSVLSSKFCMFLTFLSCCP